jgi:hypothetical protein
MDVYGDDAMYNYMRSSQGANSERQGRRQWCREGYLPSALPPEIVRAYICTCG